LTTPLLRAEGLSRHFSDYAVYNTANADIVIVAKRFGRLAEPKLERLFGGPLAAELARVGLRGPDDILVRKTGSKAMLEPLLATAQVPANSDYFMWLGRAYGRRAETSNPLSAIGHASKTHQYFERAVQLNPRNIEALNDLLEYYLEAPGFMGGGAEKAQAVINRISQVDPSEGHWAQSTLDEKHKEYGKAEQQLRRALELAPSQVSRFMDLARFLFKQGRYQEGEQNFARAEQMAPDNAKLLYVRADCYVKAGRNLDTARDLLQRYLKANVTPDDPPKADARRLLRQIQGG